MHPAHSKTTLKYSPEYLRFSERLPFEEVCHACGQTVE